MEEKQEKTYFVKIKDNLYNDILSYLDEKPNSEVGQYCVVLEGIESRMYSVEFINHLTTYFNEKCPRKEVKDFLRRFDPKNNEIEIYCQEKTPNTEEHEKDK